MIDISDHGVWKLNEIKQYWLERRPDPSVFDYETIKYLQFDGTYFKHENCLMVLMDNKTNKIIDHKYHTRENYESSYQMFKELRDRGLQPAAITIDGNTSVIRAIKTVWPDIMIQRCRTHIQRQGLSWLRRYPKLQASKDLKELLLTLTDVRDQRSKKAFYKDFQRWEKRYGDFVLSLPSKDKVYGDLQRARSLILHALPDMFHYLDDSCIAATTNKLEGYFSRLKEIYRKHRGLSKRHRQNYFAWYIELKNEV